MSGALIAVRAEIRLKQEDDVLDNDGCWRRSDIRAIRSWPGKGSFSTLLVPLLFSAKVFTPMKSYLRCTALSCAYGISRF